MLVHGGPPFFAQPDRRSGRGPPSIFQRIAGQPPRAPSDAVIPGIAALSVGNPGTPPPDGWAWVRLTDVARLETGHTPSRKHPEYWNGDIPWVSLPDARKHHASVIFETAQHTNEVGLANSAARLLPRDTVCLSRTASVGYVFRLGRPMATSQDFVNWVCSDALDPRFLTYAILAEGEHILNFGKGTTHTTIYFPEVLSFYVCLPPRAEQHRIVKNVEALLARINRFEKRLANTNRWLDAFRTSVLARAYHLTLTPHEREKHSNRPLNLLAKTFDYGTSAKSSSSGDMPVLRMGNIVKGKIDWSDLVFTSDRAEIEKYELRPGDVLFNRTNSPELVGKTAIYRGERPAIYAGYLIRIRCSNDLLPEYLTYCLNSPAGRAFCNEVKTDGVSQSNINATKLKDFAVPSIPVARQRRLVGLVDQLMALADSVELRIAAAIERSELLSRSILAKAFAGELVPTEAELARREGRSYEPASVLLERIRSEKAATSSRRRARPKAWLAAT